MVIPSTLELKIKFYGPRLCEPWPLPGDNMQIVVRTRPVFKIELSRAAYDFIMECSKLHYDSRCKRASEVGGFLYGMGVLVDDHQTLFCDLTFDELDTLMKILEIRHYFHNESNVELRKFSNLVYRAIRTYNENASDWTFAVGE